MRIPKKIDGPQSLRKSPAHPKAAPTQVEEDFNNLTDILNRALVGIARVNADGRYLSVNGSYANILGCEPDELIGQHFQKSFHPDNATIGMAAFRMMMDSGKGELETRGLRKDGSEFYIRIVMIATHDACGKLTGNYFCARGVAPPGTVDAHKQTEKELTVQSTLLETTLESMDQGVSLVDSNLNVVVLNQRATELLQFPPGRFGAGTPLEDFFRFNAERGEYGPGDIEKLVHAQVETAKQFKPHCFERIRPDGIVIEVRGKPLPGGGFITLYTDITERYNAEQALKQANALLEKRATTDCLTGLPNRFAFLEHVKHEIERSKRFGSPLSLLMLDLDHFKRINDTHGHDAGDHVLTATSQTLTAITRGSDICGRYGGEEFLVLLTETGIDNANIYAERLRNALGKMEIPLDGAKRVQVTGSIGIAQFVNEIQTPEEFIKRADEALYAAKASGRNCARVYSVKAN